MEIIKRDGRVVSFDKHKIYNAIIKSMKSVDNIDESLALNISNEIEKNAKENNKTLSVEEIQDIVESKLMSSDRKDIAKAYIIYRNDRTKERERKSKIIKGIQARINATNVKNANANVDEKSFSGREKEASSDLQKEIALNYVMSRDVAEAHKNGLIYQHDLDKFNLGEHNCLFLDFKNILSKGFKTRNGDVRPPKSISAACQLVAVAFQCQSQVQYGGVASAHLDTDLAPFVRMSFSKHFKTGLKYLENADKEYISSIPQSISIENDEAKQHKKAYEYAIDMLNNECRQATESLYHNLNTLESRQGSQVPFTSINFGRDATPEGRLISKWILEASLSGIGEHHKTSIFPISIFQYKQGDNANPEDKNYDLKQLGLKSLSKRIYPNWCNCDWSQAHEDKNDVDTIFATMGCRTLVSYDRNGLGYTRVGRGNNNPITIILPKLGIEYGICLNKRTSPDIVGFWKALDETLKLVEKAHIERFEIMVKQTPEAAPFMYDNGTIKGSEECKDSVYNALKHNTFAIGYIGIAEMCQALFGKDHTDSKEIHNFALSVVKRINEFANEASERWNLNFSCYATPAENLCRTALNTLKSQYGTLTNITDREYLTNSHHVPVWKEVSIYDKLRIEAPFCKYPTGGCITYIEVESTFVKNTKAIENIIDYAFKELDIPYLAFNFPIDTCLDCGYQDEFNDKCPSCGSTNIEQLRRVTGYLTSDWHNFNEGKQAEVKERIKHSAFTEFN